MKVEEKLGKNVFKVDKDDHIKIDRDICRTKCKTKYCLFVCPAKVYLLDKQGDVLPNPDGCLECGACLIACLPQALSWHYPKAGFGVQYRFS
ncbi:MAG: ferredoxin family protein [Candidatus Bathyarchaeia archaeon]